MGSRLHRAILLTLSSHIADLLRPRAITLLLGLLPRASMASHSTLRRRVNSVSLPKANIPHLNTPLRKAGIMVHHPRRATLQLGILPPGTLLHPDKLRILVRAIPQRQDHTASIRRRSNPRFPSNPQLPRDLRRPLHRATLPAKRHKETTANRQRYFAKQ